MDGDGGAARARRRRSDGERSRSAILDEAARLATIEGLGGLSIGRLANAVGMSKSGLFAHFGSKEDLQLATVEAAGAVFADRVMAPADAAAGGLERLRTLIDGYLGYVEVDVFPGGCFFASVMAEVDMQPGPVRDELVRFLGRWLETLEAAVRDAQAEGAIDRREDPAQLAFEIEALLLFSNAMHVVDRSPGPMTRARRAIDARLAGAGAGQSRPARSRRARGAS